MRRKPVFTFIISCLSNDVSVSCECFLCDFVVKGSNSTAARKKSPFGSVLVKDQPSGMRDQSFSTEAGEYKLFESNACKETHFEWLGQGLGRFWSCFYRWIANFDELPDFKMFWLIRGHRLIDCSLDRSIVRSIDRLIDWLITRLIDYSIDRLIDGLMDGWMDGLIDGLIDWLIINRSS